MNWLWNSSFQLHSHHCIEPSSTPHEQAQAHPEAVAIATKPTPLLKTHPSSMLAHRFGPLIAKDTAIRVL
jgi:hypothetical protein